MALIKKDAQRVSRSANGEIEVTTIHHESNGSETLSMIEVTMRSGCYAQPHVCTNTEEAVHVLEGEFEVSYNDAMGNLNEGDCICYPAGVIRSYRYTGLNIGRLLFISPDPKPHWQKSAQNKVKPPLNPSYVHIGSGWTKYMEGVERQTFCSPKEVGARSMFASDIIVKPGGIIPIHRHPTDVSLFCTGDGVVFMYGNEALKANAGDALLVEAGVQHGVKNESSKDAYFLETYPTGDPKREDIDPGGLDKLGFFRKELNKRR